MNETNVHVLDKKKFDEDDEYRFEKPIIKLNLINYHA